ncbi:MAG: succinylglutamate desuccinylase [Pseudomonadales bacterium]
MKFARLMHSNRIPGIGLTVIAAFFLASANLAVADESAEVEEAAKADTAIEKASDIDLDKPVVKAKTEKQPAKKVAKKNVKKKPNKDSKSESETEQEAPPKVAKKKIPKAESIDLEKPVVKDKPKDEKQVVDAPQPPVEELSPEDTKEPDEEKTEVDVADVDKGSKKKKKRKAKKDEEKEDEGIPFILLGAEVPPGTSTRLSWSPSETFEGIANPTPVLVVNGNKPGPVLCLTAAVHGDELNGIEIVRRMLYNIDADKLAGAVIGVPIVNLQGFHRTSRYLADRRDLNRFFPGNPYGSSAARIAYSFFNEVISRCSALVDLHTGSFYRTNLPQLRANLNNPDVVELTHGFGATVVLHSDAAVGTLRRSAVDAGIPAVTLEAGEPMRVQEKEVDHGVKGIQTLLHHLKMYKKPGLWGEPEPVYYQSSWVRSDQGGILFTRVHLGKRVRKGDLLGTVTDPITNVRAEITSPHNGRVLGMALNQVVMPGFAAFRIGIQKSEDEIVEPAQELDTAGDDSSQIETAPDQKSIARSDIDQRDNEDSE